MKGLITLTFKAGNNEKQKKWKPISFLNITYKIYTKVFQLQLQPICYDVINCNQTTFLPLRCILEYVFLTHEK
jgi:hypothetical protein